MIARYIDAEKLKEALSADTQHIRDWDVDLYDLIMMDIDEAPTADVVEVSKVIEIIREVQQYSLVSEDVVRKILELGKSQKEEVNSNA